jgi:hypothetical protein
MPVGLLSTRRGLLTGSYRVIRGGDWDYWGDWDDRQELPVSAWCHGGPGCGVLKNR